MPDEKHVQNLRIEVTVLIAKTGTVTIQHGDLMR